MVNRRIRLTRFAKIHRKKPRSKKTDNENNEGSRSSRSFKTKSNESILRESNTTKSTEFINTTTTTTTTPTVTHNRLVTVIEPNDVHCFEDDHQSVLSSDYNDEESEIAVIESLERLSMRLDGFDAYVLVGLWVSTSCFGDLLIGDFRHRDGALPPFLRVGVLICGLFISLFGLYSTVVFATTILYGKTAVGLNRDEAFFSFMANTGKQRARAFTALVHSMLVYAIIICLVAMNELPNYKYIPPVAMGLGYLVYIGAKDVWAILNAASPIFAPAPTSEDEENNSGNNNNNNNNSVSTNNSSQDSSTKEKRKRVVPYSKSTIDRRKMMKSFRGLDSVHMKKVASSTRNLNFKKD